MTGVLNSRLMRNQSKMNQPGWTQQDFTQQRNMMGSTMGSTIMPGGKAMLDQSMFSSIQGSPEKIKLRMKEWQKAEEQDLTDQLERIDQRIQQAYIRSSQ